MKVLFLGTPAFGAVVLEKILRSKHEVLAVICQPDRINGRGNKISFCPVKQCATENGVKVLQYEKINEHIDEIVAFGADIMVTCAYGQILKQPILDLCRHGIINVHASLLPEYRGSSPVEWAIIDGKDKIGVTIMQTALGVDTGDIICQKSFTLNGDENAAEALEKLSYVGADLLVETLDLIESGKATFTKQDEKSATHTRMFDKEDGLIDFGKSALVVHNFVRGVNPRPGAFTFCPNGRLKVLKAEPTPGTGGTVPGEVVVSSSKEGLTVKCGDGYIRLLTVQGENSKAMDAKTYLLGKKMAVGTVLGKNGDTI